MVPRWFLAVVASCAVVLTIAVSYAVVVRAQGEAWVNLSSQGSGPAFFNRRTGEICALANDGKAACLPFLKERRSSVAPK